MANPKPIIHNRTPVYSNPSQLNAINKNASAYQKALKSQSINYSRNASAFQNSLQQSHPNVDFRNPLWYQKHFASPINGQTNHEHAMSYARPLNETCSSDDSLDYSYNDSNNYHYNSQNDILLNQNNLQKQVNDLTTLLNQIQTQHKTQTNTQSNMTTMNKASIIFSKSVINSTEIQETPKYYKSSDNSKFIDKIDNSLINEKKYLLEEIKSLKKINENLKNELFILSSKYDIEIQINDKIEIMEMVNLSLKQQVNILAEYINSFNSSNKEINEQIENINTIFL
jgi:hypothetical protein